MGVFAEIFGFINKQSFASKDKHIFYKIVDSDHSGRFILQCINTKATILTNLSDLAHDHTLISALHPIQACFVGIEYTSALSKSLLSSSIKTSPQSVEQIHRYGKYCLCYQDRQGDITFVDHQSKKEYRMDPRDIALDQELIEEFDASQAFYIGMCAGTKLKKRIKSVDTQKHPYLRLVK